MSLTAVAISLFISSAFMLLKSVLDIYAKFIELRHKYSFDFYAAQHLPRIKSHQELASLLYQFYYADQATSVSVLADINAFIIRESLYFDTVLIDSIRQLTSTSHKNEALTLIITLQTSLPSIPHEPFMVSFKDFIKFVPVVFRK